MAMQRQRIDPRDVLDRSNPTKGSACLHVACRENHSSPTQNKPCFERHAVIEAKGQRKTTCLRLQGQGIFASPRRGNGLFAAKSTSTFCFGRAYLMAAPYPTAVLCIHK